MFGQEIGDAGRRPDQDQEARPRHQEGRAGRELPQAAARDLERHPRAAGQARRPAAQHAHARAHEAREAPARSPRRRWRSTRRWPAAWACRACARSWRSWPSAWLNPEAYATVVDRLADVCARERRPRSRRSARAAGQARRSKACKAEVSGREKKPYSIWRKMERKQISLEQLSDIYGFRVVVDDVDDCYRALGVVHSTWRAVPGRFKDYISTPKQNDYQSIHTTVVGPRHQRVELQIRTERHARDRRIRRRRARALQGRRRPRTAPAAALRRARPTPIAGCAAWSTSARRRQPRGIPRAHQARAVPGPGVLLHAEGAADRAAARRHADRLRLCGAHRHRQLLRRRQDQRPPACRSRRELRNGDEVEIITARARCRRRPGSASPSPARRARRSAARPAMPCARQYSELGRASLERRLRSAAARVFRREARERGLARLSQKSVEDVHRRGRPRRAARRRRGARRLPRAQAPPAARKRAPRARAQGEEGWFNLAKVIGLKFRWPGQRRRKRRCRAEPKPGGLPIRGLRDDVPVTFEEGGAVPGDRIVGVLTAGEGIRIFRSTRRRSDDYEHERWIDVTWDIDEDNPERFPAKISVTALNEPGTLAQIAQVIGEADGNIDNVKMMRRARRLHRDADRARGVGSEALERHHRGPARQGHGIERRAGEHIAAARKRRGAWSLEGKAPNMLRLCRQQGAVSGCVWSWQGCDAVQAP